MSVHDLGRELYPLETRRVNPLTAIVRAAMARPLADYYLVTAVTAALTGMGLFMVLSASSVYAMVTTGDAYSIERWQLVAAAVGVVAAFVCSRISLRGYIVIAWLAMLLAVLLLIITIIPGGPGSSVGGQQAWLSLGPLRTVQPSEFAKAAIVVWGAAVFAQPMRADRLDEPKALLIPYLPVAGLTLGLVLLEKDLGTAVIVAAIIVMQLWLVGAPAKVMGWLITTGLLAGMGVIMFSASHRAKVLSFLAARFPFLHLATQATSDQPDNAIYALATGGLFGTGPGASRQKWGGLYNGAHTDYILAVLGEELGLLGILVVLGLLLTLVYTAVRIARRSQHLFWRVAASAFAGWIMVQALVNTLVAFGLLPVIGVPFPFLSYGGSALVSCFIGIGVLLAAARHEPEAQAELLSKSRANRVAGAVVARSA